MHHGIGHMVMGWTVAWSVEGEVNTPSYLRSPPPGHTTLVRPGQSPVTHQHPLVRPGHHPPWSHPPPPRKQRTRQYGQCTGGKKFKTRKMNTSIR